MTSSTNTQLKFYSFFLRLKNLIFIFRYDVSLTKIFFPYIDKKVCMCFILIFFERMKLCLSKQLFFGLNKYSSIRNLIFNQTKIQLKIVQQAQ
jgi:hypothetical protein